MANIRSICVYCGASGRGDRRHHEAAARFGRLLAAAGIELVFGGGKVGLMGVIADATLAAGGRVTGIIPDHLIKAEVGHGAVTDLIITDSMHVRKETMFRRADAFAVLPGGPGTLDETFEILTWKQLALHDKPVVIVDLHGYWQPLIALIDGLIDQGYARADFRDLYMVVADVDQVLPAIAAAPQPRFPPRVPEM
ncbi:MAG: TIGR00730 family Rossman fold protein [Proteobacteria bacterium]|nr:TIGR00730 family Rossman fold protein [Pseudomonadota bacterium]